MGTMTTLPRGRALTVEDLEAMPEDGQRYELIDGVLVVSASPVPAHQMVVSSLMEVLQRARPAGWWVLTAPMDVLATDTAVQPDIAVFGPFSEETKRARRLATLPLLVAEVLSPSTRLTDLNIKFARYERAGVPAYWVVDPTTLTLVVWELVEGRYVEVAEVGPEESWAAGRPFEVTIAPGRLLG